MNQIQTMIDGAIAYNVGQFSNGHQSQQNPIDANLPPRPDPFNPRSDALPNTSHNAEDIPPPPPIIEDDSLPELQLRNMSEELKHKTLELEEVKKEVIRLQTDKSNLKTAFNKVRVDLLSTSERMEDFAMAQQQCDALSVAKAEEKTRLLGKTPTTPQAASAAETAEKEELTYTYRSAKYLVKLNKYSDAEISFSRVLKRRKDNDPDIKDAFTREVQFGLCNVLCLQGMPEKLGEAEKLYHAEANLESQDSQKPDNRDWAVRNAFHLACLRVQQHKYKIAIDNLQNVWSKSDDVSAECLTEMQSGVASLLETFRQENPDRYSRRVLGIIRHSNGTMADSLVAAVRATGEHLYEGGQHEKAVDFLHVAWINTLPTAPRAEKFKLGWELAWSFCHTTRHDEAKIFLQSLLKHFDTPPDHFQDRVRALLAHTQLRAGKTVHAKHNAKIVYDKHKTNNIFESHLGTHEYHHADTLLRAIAQKGFCCTEQPEAKTIWKEVYQNAQNLRRDPSNREQVRHHAETGHLLAEKCLCYRSQRKRRALSGCTTIKDQANRLLEQGHRRERTYRADSGPGNARLQLPSKLGAPTSASKKPRGLFSGKR